MIIKSPICLMVFVTHFVSKNGSKRIICVSCIYHFYCPLSLFTQRIFKVLVLFFFPFVCVFFRIWFFYWILSCYSIWFGDRLLIFYWCASSLFCDDAKCWNGKRFQYAWNSWSEWTIHISYAYIFSVIKNGAKIRNNHRRKRLTQKLNTIFIWALSSISCCPSCYWTQQHLAKSHLH